MELNLNQSPQKKSVVQKVKCFFVRPTELFADYKENPKWGLSFIILALISAIFTFLSKIVAKDAYNDLFNGQLAKLPPDQVEAARKSMEVFNSPVMNGVSAVFGAISICAFVLILALIYFGLIKLFKGKVKFIQVFSVYVLTCWTMVFSMIFKLAYTYLTHKMTYFNFQPTYMDALLNNLDIFVLWQSILLVFGFSKIADIDELKSTIIVVLVWLGTLAISIIPIMLK